MRVDLVCLPLARRLKGQLPGAIGFEATGAQSVQHGFGDNRTGRISYAQNTA